MEDLKYKNENIEKEPIFKGKELSFKIRKRFYRIER